MTLTPSAGTTTRLGIPIAAIVALWFLASLTLSLTGAFYTENRPPLAIASFALLPVLAFAIVYFIFAEFRKFVLRANPALLTLSHIWRIVGIAFLVLYYRGQVPGVWALPAGWGDIAIGVTAPFLAWAIWRRIAGKQLIVVWNAFGLLDLFAAITLGVLSSNGPLGILAHGATTAIMGTFPLSIIPTFLVPIFFIFHLITIRIANQADGRNVQIRRTQINQG
jgi:hypothetical protein